jgi:protein-tyrosine phosphatase
MICTDHAQLGASGDLVAMLMNRFKVLYVCSANLCGSVTAAALMTRALEGRSPVPEWGVMSAGLDVRPGAALPSPIADVMVKCGIALNTRPQQIDSSVVHVADLVLTAERAQRARIVRALPSAGRRTFTIRQFGRLCAAGREASGIKFTGVGGDLLEVAEIGRTFVQPVDLSSDDIDDPTAVGTETAMWNCVLTIQDSIRDVVGE